MVFCVSELADYQELKHHRVGPRVNEWEKGCRRPQESRILGKSRSHIPRSIIFNSFNILSHFNITFL